jgi:leucyl-tRNA---protein transferase
MTPFYFSLNPESLSGTELDLYLSLGWYRMRQSIFTSSHVELGGIYRVHWLRYGIANLKDRISHKRIRNRNRYFRFTIEDYVSIGAEYAALHAQYRATIDFDGAWSIEECLFGAKQTDVNIFNSKVISVFDDTKLIAAGYFDVGAKTAASILHFYDPAYGKYSLGKYLILLTLDYLKSRHYEFYYPGYVVEGLNKMNYKLFLGKENAEYFDPETISWKPFQEGILGDLKI